MAVRSDLQILESAEAVAQAAATAFCDIVSKSPRDRVAVCLSGGSTPQSLYRLLVEPQYARGIPWDRIHWFWGDERFVPLRDPRSNAGMAWGTFLALAPVLRETIHVVPTAANVQDSAELYEQRLKAFYGARELDPANPLFDLVLMGMGEDGHTASLFPGSSALSERQRWVTAVEEAGQEPYVPRVTLTIPALESTVEMLFLVSGPGKRKALVRVLAGDDLPAGRVRPVGRLRWFVDRAAAPENTP